MPIFITWIFTLVIGTIIFQAVRARFFLGARWNNVALIVTTALIYIGTYYVGLLFGQLVWGTTVVLLRVVLVIVALAFVILGSYYLYIKYVVNPRRKKGPHINPNNGDPIQEAEVIEIIENEPKNRKN